MAAKIPLGVATRRFLKTPGGSALAKGIAFSGVAGTVGLAGGYSLRSFGAARERIEAAKNPPLQREDVDPDPTQPGDEGTLFYDTKTGRVYGVGPGGVPGDVQLAWPSSRPIMALYSSITAESELRQPSGWRPA